MLQALLALIPLFAGPEVPIRAGSPIEFDGRLEPGEWDDAFTLSRELPDGKRLRFALKRTGRWIAIGVAADRAYEGESLRLYVTDRNEPWVTAVYSGLGNPVTPPILWRRGPPGQLQDMRYAPECPRGGRLRISVDDPGRWSAELLVRLGTLGIGRADLRTFHALLLVGVERPERRTWLTLPDNVENPLEVDSYARLASADGWGADEEWEPIPREVSFEFDDNELLYHLYLEHDRIELRGSDLPLVIGAAVRPRDRAKIATLRGRLEDGRLRNPSLPQWRYYLARLLHEANRYEEAAEILATVPEHLHGSDAMANLLAEHALDTQDFERARELCRTYPNARDMRNVMALALRGTDARAAEEKRLAEQEQAPERNPRVRVDTARGSFVIELFEDDAPNAVRNFMDLVMRRSYYDGMEFHAVMGGQFTMIGDPRTLPGAPEDPEQPDGPPWALKKDDSARPLLRGYVSTVPKESGAQVYHGSQWLIALSPQLREQRNVAVFGRVVEGLDVVEQLAQGDVCEHIEVLFKRNHSYDTLASRLK